MLTEAADGAATAIEGVPPWILWLGGTVLPPIVAVLVLWLKRLLKVEEPTERAPDTEAQTVNQGTPVTPAQTQPVQQAPAQQATPDPEIALIAEMVTGLREDLRDTREAFAVATRTHNEAMAAAERAHEQSMREVTAKLAERERLIVRLEATIDTLTGRRQQ